MTPAHAALGRNIKSAAKKKNGSLQPQKLKKPPLPQRFLSYFKIDSIQKLNRTSGEVLVLHI
jgi:hypothetical protein